MISKLITPLTTIALAIIFVLIDHSLASALPLDPSEIKTGAVVAPVITAGGYLAYKVLMWVFADGHTESADTDKKKGKKK